MADRTLRPLAALALGAFAFASVPLAASRADRHVLHAAEAGQAGQRDLAGRRDGRRDGAGLRARRTARSARSRSQKSTNHGDDAAALEIAKGSTYKPGIRDAKPIDAFYTMALKFNGSSVVNDTGTTSNQVVAANALIRANKYRRREDRAAVVPRGASRRQGRGGAARRRGRVPQRRGRRGRGVRRGRHDPGRNSRSSPPRRTPTPRSTRSRRRTTTRRSRSPTRRSRCSRT